MVVRPLELPDEPSAALVLLQTTSRSQPVVVFKRSPTCPISLGAEAEFRTWLSGLGPYDSLCWSLIDVLARRPLARGLTELLGIQHESPQALWFLGGQVRWHASHGMLTSQRFSKALAQP